MQTRNDADWRAIEVARNRDEARERLPATVRTNAMQIAAWYASVSLLCRPLADATMAWAVPFLWGVTVLTLGIVICAAVFPEDCMAPAGRRLPRPRPWYQEVARAFHPFLPVLAASEAVLVACTATCEGQWTEEE